MARAHVLPDWNAPLDVEEVLARIPPDAVVRGLFFQELARQCEARGKPPPPSMPPRLVPFGNYPLHAYCSSVIETARAIEPDVPLREGVRRVGRAAYPALAQSMIGRVVFGVLGNDYLAIIRLCAKAYSMSLNIGRAETLESGPGRAVVRLDDMFNLFDSFQVGVFEGSLESCNKQGTVAVWRETPISGEFLVTWKT
jgi:uncharacterized protein (TIGR02265 family)